MTKAEWASWAQTAGVFFALFMPYVILYSKKRNAFNILKGYLNSFQYSIESMEDYIKNGKLKIGKPIDFDQSLDFARDCIYYIKSSEAQVKVQALNVSENLHDQILIFYRNINVLNEELINGKNNLKIIKNPGNYSEEEVDRLKNEEINEKTIKLVIVKTLEKNDFQEKLAEIIKG